MKKEINRPFGFAGDNNMVKTGIFHLRREMPPHVGRAFPAAEDVLGLDRETAGARRQGPDQGSGAEDQQVFGIRPFRPRVHFLEKQPGVDRPSADPLPGIILRILRPGFLPRQVHPQDLPGQPPPDFINVQSLIFHFVFPKPDSCRNERTTAAPPPGRDHRCHPVSNGFPPFRDFSEPGSSRLPGRRSGDDGRSRPARRSGSHNIFRESSEFSFQNKTGKKRIVLAEQIHYKPP